MGFIDELYSQDEHEPGDITDLARRKKEKEDKGRKTAPGIIEAAMTEKSFGIERGKKGFDKGEDLTKADKDSILKRALRLLSSKMDYNPATKDDEELSKIYQQGDKTHKRWKEAQAFWNWKRSQK